MLRPFRIPETRLLAINELVVQVTLTFRTDEDEEVRYRYELDAELQSLVQTAVVSLVNCGYTNGVARGPGFILHQMRKKWPIGRRYIFTRHGEPQHSSLHKYFLQLELVDEVDERDEVPVVEIAELRGVAQSPSLSSMAGSTIEGLDAVTLPMEAILGHVGHRRSGSGYSVHSGYSGRSGYSERQSFGYDRAGQRPESPSPRREELESEYRSARERAGELQGSHGDASMQGVGGDSGFGSSGQGTVPTRSISRSSVGSVRTMQSVEMHGRERVGQGVEMNARERARQSISPQVRPSAVAAAAASGPARRTTESPRKPHSPANSSGEQLSLGRTSWYRSLHGISPLSRQQKSLSSSDNEIHLSALSEPADSATQIPRVAGNAQPMSGLRPPRAPVAKESGLNGLAQRWTRKILSPINIHRAKHSRRGSTLARELGSSDAESDDVSDFTGLESDKVSAIPVSRIPLPASRVAKPSDQPEIRAGSTGISRPDMPPPKTRPVRQPPVENPESVSIPASVRSALLRRLKSPLGHRPDRSASRLSVRERISAFNGLMVNGAKQTRASESVGIPTPDTEPADIERVGASKPLRPESALITPPFSASPVRTRVGTSTGFISMASPANMSVVDRPQSRASSVTNGRAASPALSHMSNVSTRVQDAINALERASSANHVTPRNGEPLVLGRSSGTKRGATADRDYMASPTKRPRAPSAAHDGSRAGSRLNPLNMVQRMVRRHTGR
ncbi:hypothetical protein GGH12_005254 [Coemansia sp. RSA 1822]|nr:hypothetical protein IW147_003327 [Coemansia sp. RSA 720]KAJ2559760.1 hypothetical protein GGH12_005254 [Coemansia sp. RSA 1822]